MTTSQTESTLRTQVPLSEVPASDDSGVKDKVKDTAQSVKVEGGELRSTIKDEALNLKDSVSEETASLARSAKVEAQGFKEEVKVQASGLVGETKEQLHAHSKEQQAKLGKTLNVFAEDLKKMSQGQDGPAASLVGALGVKVESLASVSKDGDLNDTILSFKNFAKTHPGTFLLSAGALGFTLSRVVMAAKGPSEKVGQTNSEQSLRADASTSKTETVYPPDPSVTPWEADDEFARPQQGTYLSSSPESEGVQNGFIAGDQNLNSRSDIYPVEGRSHNV